MSRPAPGPLLGADTTTPQGGVAVLSGGSIECVAFGDVPPSNRLMPEVRALLQRIDVSVADLEAVAMAVGPGSFTGIRVGLATLRALADAVGCPAAGVSTLAALAEAADRPGRHVAAWLDAGRGEVYAWFRPAAGPGGEETLAPPAEILAMLPPEPVVFAGPAAQRHAAAIERRPGAHPGDEILAALPPLAPAVARLARAAVDAGRITPPEARYLRSPDVLRARV